VTTQDPGRLSVILAAVREGRAGAGDRLYEHVYAELHRIAQREMRREHRRPTLLQTTGLVNEAWMRMAGNRPEDWKDRRYFFAAAAQAMRRILVDSARKRRAQRRGGDADRITLRSDVAGASPSYDVLALHEALEGLATIRQRAARVVELRFFGGLTVSETAESLEISPRSVDSDWNFARRWLERAMTEGPGPAPPA
jgi:RNA polymerase sigma factor (TIGR02999 family)